MNRTLSTGLAAATALATLVCWWATQGDAPEAPAFFGRWSPLRFGFALGVTYCAFWLVRALVSRRPRSVVFQFVALSFSLALLIVLLELPALLLGVDYAQVLGVGGAERFTHMHPAENPAMLKDPDVGWRHRPGTGFSGEVSGDLVELLGIATPRKYAVDITYDANGFRNPGPVPNPDVVLVGDSFVEAALVPLEETLATRLAQATRREVLNLGVTGYGPEQMRLALEHYGLPSRPNWVLWFFFEGNDLIDTGRFEFLRKQRAAGKVPQRAFRDRAFVVNLLARTAALTQPPRTQDTDYARARRAVFTRASTPDQRDVYFAFDGAQAGHIEHFDAVKAEILAARARTEAAGAAFVLLYVPVKLRVLRDLCVFEAESVVAEWIPDDFPALMADFVAEAGLDYIDLTPVLRRAADTGRSPYYPDDGHWNAVAHEVVATHVLEHMRAHDAAAPSGSAALPR